MKYKRLICAGFAAVMLMGGGTVNVFAESEFTDDYSAGYVYSVGGLATPKIVSASKGRAHIRLKWNKIKGASGYKVYQKTKSGYKCVKTIKGNGSVTTLMDGFNSHTRYTFKVRAYSKKNGTVKYSKYSPAKSVTTTYGQGTHNYTCKDFSIEDKNNMWQIGSFENWYYDYYAEFDYSPDGEVKDDCYCVVTSRKWADITLQDAVEDYLWNVDESAFYSDDPAEDTVNSWDFTVTYSKKFGADCALLELTKFPEKKDMTVIVYENGIVYEIYYGYLRSNTEGKNEMKKLLKNIKLTY